MRVPPPLPRLQRATARLHSTASQEGSADAASGAAPRARTIGLWLLGTAGMVYTMVVVGGWTRITKSGLSMVTWHPVWEKYDPKGEFERYKSSPEYVRVNRHMDAEDFEQIYFWEWFHRMWGRAIGVAFMGPLALFAATKGGIPKAHFGVPVRAKVGGLLALGAAQGGIGWWMVKSGLEHERFDEYSIPRVSPYRLATHLGIAFSIYSLLVWTGLDLIRGKPTAVTSEQKAACRRLLRPAMGATGVIALTVASGAFVAGNDAGHAYNDWPLMAGQFVPEQFWIDKLGWLNIFENTATVQFDHRMLAYSSLASVVYLKIIRAKLKKVSPGCVPLGVNRGMNAMAGIVLAQVGLGIATLMLYVPPSLAAAHQAGALALLTSGLYVTHGIYRGVKSTGAAAGVAAAVPKEAKAAAAILGLVAANQAFEGEVRNVSRE